MDRPALVAVLVVGIVVARAADRLWHSPLVHGRPGMRKPAAEPSTLRKVLELQRARLNDVTPVLLVASVWTEIWLSTALLAEHYWGWPVLALLVGLRLRHLQEITHFAVHGVLARRRCIGDALAEIGFQAPLMLPSVANRRRLHVREHHPNATVRGVDPNLDLLARSGMTRGWTRRNFVRFVLRPVAPAGIDATIRSLLGDVVGRLATGSFGWIAAPLVIGATGYALGGWPGLLFGVIVPRLITYPCFAWLSLLIEHRWLSAPEPTGVSRSDEAARCLRLYRRRPLLQAMARVSWLPYGDAFHFAHSVHPAVRWNYLPLLDSRLEDDVREFQTVLSGSDSAMANFFRDGAVADSGDA